MVMDCMIEGSMTPMNTGWRSAVSVRLMHAGVRTWLMDRGNWDVVQYGVPVNQEDMIVTQLAFTIVILLGLERAGLTSHISDDDMNDYLHAWRYLGHLMGISEEHNIYMNSHKYAKNLGTAVLPRLPHVWQRVGCMMGRTAPVCPVALLVPSCH